VGSDTPLNKVLQGIRPCGTKSCGVSNPTEQHSKTNISANSKKNSKIFSGVNSGTRWDRFVEKTRGQKSRATVPLNKLVVVYAFTLLYNTLLLLQPGAQYPFCLVLYCIPVTIFFPWCPHLSVFASYNTLSVVYHLYINLPVYMACYIALPMLSACSRPPFYLADTMPSLDFTSLLSRHFPTSPSLFSLLLFYNFNTFLLLLKFLSVFMPIHCPVPNVSF
jgi:hypothetical protein